MTLTQETQDGAAELGKALAEKKAESFVGGFRKLERAVFKLLDDYTPSYETLRRYHAGEIATMCAVTHPLFRRNPRNCGFRPAP